jgi:hypothetical protein
LVTKRKKIALEIALSLAGILLAAGFLEVYLRMVLFHGFKLGDGIFRRVDLYADYFSGDDYWKLMYILEGSGASPWNPHPFLGWYGKFDPVTYEHNDNKSVGEKTPALLYGDSFAACETYVCFQEILNGDKEFSEYYHLLNYGVHAYGLDQIELLYEKSSGLYEDPAVIFSFLAEDIDRSVLSFRLRPKPYYKTEDGGLVLGGVPVDPDPANFLKEHPVSIRSYLWALVKHSKLLPGKIGAYLRGDGQTIEEKIELNSSIMQKVIDDLKRRDIPFIFVVFHADWPDPIDGPDTWRNDFIREILDKNQVQYVWTKGLILEDMKKTGNDLTAYFDSTRHYTDYTNALIAREMKRVLMLKKNFASH